MTDDTNLFNFQEGRRLAAEGAERAHTAAADAWKDHARETVLEVGRMMPVFTMDDVIRWCMTRSLPMPEKAVAWGAVFQRLSAAKLIQATGTFRNSERTSRHSGPVREWRLR